MTDIRTRLADAIMEASYGYWYEKNTLGCDTRGEEPATFVADVLLSLPGIAIVPVDIEDDGDPYYWWQESMSHRAAADRISYGEWLKREVQAADAAEADQ